VNKTLPITRVDVVRAAYGLIDEYGSEALARAMDRASAVRRDGFESVANTWYLICEAIDEIQTEREQ
jgi:hypothetical protein